MIFKFPACVSRLVLSCTSILHSVLCDEVVPIFAETAVEYLTSFETCFETEDKGLRLAGPICLLEQDLDVSGVDAVGLSYKIVGELEYFVLEDSRIIDFTQLISRNPVCSVEFGCLFRHIDDL
jgi:hypothetical protein